MMRCDVESQIVAMFAVDLGDKAVIIRPCDEMRIPLKDSVMLRWYAKAIRSGAKVFAEGSTDELLKKETEYAY